MITVYRVEVVAITNEPELIETFEFSSLAEVFDYLRGRGLPLTSESETAIQAHPVTTTNVFMEMVKRADVAYSARVFYHIEVIEGGAA